VVPQNIHQGLDKSNLKNHESRSSELVSHNDSFLYPYYDIGYIRINNNCFGEKKGTGFFITENVSLISAHAAFSALCGFTSYASKEIAYHSEGGFPISHYPTIDAANIQVPNSFVINAVVTNPSDYAVLRFNASFSAAKHILLAEYIQLDVGDEVSFIGYPIPSIETPGMTKYKDEFLPLEPSQFTIETPLAASQHGLSGSPVFANNDFIYAIGNVFGGSTNDP